MRSVVVPAYSSADVVERSLAALERACEQVDEEIEILVVLNRPLHDLQAGRRARLLPVSHNLGFAGGVMHGIREAAGDWIVVVNDDVVVQPDALQALFAAPTSDRTGAVTGLLFFADRPHVVNGAGIDLDALGVASERFVGLGADAAVGPARVFGGTGGFTMYRRAMLDEVGGFDESFFAYLEDVDLAWRAQMAGWSCVFEPAARALHAHSLALGHGSPSKHFLVGRNRVRMLAKNATSAQLRRAALGIVLYDLGYVAYAALVDRTLAPLRGRLAGAGDWRRYRALGAAARAPVALSAPRWFGSALRRDRAYRS